jgi:membrane protein
MLESKTHAASRLFGTRPFVLARTVAIETYRHHAFDHAATMSFYFFLGLIPLILCAGLLAGHFVESQAAEALVQPLYRAMPGVAADLFRTEVREVATARVGTVAPLSILGFIWLTTNGVHNLMDVFELLIHVAPRPWWRQRLLAMAWLAGLLVVGALATWVLLIMSGLSAALDDATRLPLLVREASGLVAAGWRRVGVLCAFAAISSCALAVFYRIAILHPPGIRRRVWPGTIVAHILWVAVSWGFGAYVKTMAHYAVFYGSLATVAVVLLWLYLTSLALIVGAEVNAQLEGIQHDRVRSTTLPTIQAL